MNTLHKFAALTLSAVLSVCLLLRLLRRITARRARAVGLALLCAGLYFLGATIGAMVTSTGLGRRKPMELLQIKE